MESNVAIDREAEGIVRSLARTLTNPREGECLFCYVARMLDEFGCDNTLRFARSYRDRRAPRATSLERRLGDMGGFCDCEIFLNGMTVAPYLLTEDADGNKVAGTVPECLTVRRGSTQSCGHWVRVRRGVGGW